MTPPRTDPAISPPGRTTTAPLDASAVAGLAVLVDEWASRMEGWDAGAILTWAAEHFGERLAVTMSMQDTVLAELAARHAPEAELLFLDTGYHFEETLATSAGVDARYALRLRTVTPTLTVAEQNDAYGHALYARDPAACCRMRKVEPLARAMDPYLAWVTGIRRVDGPTRAATPVLELDRTGRVKISPLVAWSDDELQKFIAEHDLIVHPLTLTGYPSIGCATCTMPVAPGEDPRSGRWAGSTKTECGLHT